MFLQLPELALIPGRVGVLFHKQMDLSVLTFHDTEVFRLCSRSAISKNCHTGESRYPVFFGFWMPVEDSTLRDQVRHDKIYPTNNSSHLRDTTLAASAAFNALILSNHI